MTQDKNVLDAQGHPSRAEGRSQGKSHVEWSWKTKGRDPQIKPHVDLTKEHPSQCHVQTLWGRRLRSSIQLQSSLMALPDKLQSWNLSSRLIREQRGNCLPHCNLEAGFQQATCRVLLQDQMIRFSNETLYRVPPSNPWKLNFDIL